LPVKPPWFLIAPALLTGVVLGVLLVRGHSVESAAPWTLVAGLIAFGAALAISGSNIRSNSVEIGRGLFVSGLVALAVFWVQTELDAQEKFDEERAAEQRRAEESRDRERDAREQLLLQIAFTRDLSGIDLSGVDLRELYLRGKILRGADLREADLTRANLVDVDLRGADLRGSQLVRAKLMDADLRGADLRRAEFSRADLSGATMTDVDVGRADFQHADFSGARVELLLGSFGGRRNRDASFAHADFTDAKFSGVISGDFRNTYFFDTSLDGLVMFANLSDATLKLPEEGLRESHSLYVCRSTFRGSVVGGDFRPVLFHHTDFSETQIFGPTLFGDIRESTFTRLQRTHTAIAPYVRASYPRRAAFPSPFLRAMIDANTPRKRWLMTRGADLWTALDLSKGACRLDAKHDRLLRRGATLPVPKRVPGVRKVIRLR
jgi:uncharacterized protein YjbI with pentapeptide repeats